MAPREKTDAVVIVFDTGQSVGQKHSDDGVTFFDKAKECISWIIKRKIMSISKDLVCLLLTGTNESGDDDDDGLGMSLCRNVNVKFDFQLASWDMLNYIDNEVEPSKMISDWVGALAVSTEKLKSLGECYNVNSKTVVIFSDLKDTFTDSIDYALANVKDLNIEITVIGPDYISQTLESNEDDEPSQKKRRLESDICHLRTEERINGEELLHIMWDRLGDSIRISNFDSALRQLSSYSRKTVRANPWNCVMDIGDVKICIQVFKKIDRKIPFRASLKCAKPTDSSHPEGSSERTFIDIVRDKIMYYKHIEQDSVQAKEISVEQEEIIPGFRYGVSVIPFSDEDKTVLGYKPGKKCFSVLGFTPVENVPNYVLIGEGSYIVVPRENDEKSEVALSALIQAMSESGNVAIVRRVYSDERGLTLGVLYPVVEEGVVSELSHKECLVLIELAFEEDIRTIRLPRLRRIKKKITPEQYKVIDDFIEEMDLMKVKSGIKGETYEALDLCSRHEMKSQFFQHCLVHKALYPNKPLPKTLPGHCEKYITQLHSLNNKSRVFGEKFSELFSAKKKTDGNTEKGNSNVDTVSFYTFTSNEEKTAMNCFKKLFNLHKYPTVEAITHLLDISVREFHFNVKDVVEAFLHFTKVTRQSTLDDFSDNYNYWMRRLRINLGIEGELVERYWKGVIEGNLGLITVEEHKDSYAKKEDADFFIDSLKCKVEETEEEKRKMDEEVEEAVNLLF